jgi:antitoxin VapB
VALSIRSPKVEGLARELSRRTGKTMTEAIGAAITKQLEGLGSRKDSRRSKLAAIAAACAEAKDLDTRSPEEILGYDESGGFGHGDR